MTQSGPEQLLHGPLSWAGGWQSLGSGKATTQVLLIQQPVMPTPSFSTPTPSSCLAPRQAPEKKAGSCSSNFQSNKGSYLPILNSYPRIAPHPRKESTEVKGSVWGGGVKESEGQSQSKRVCTEEEKREAGSVLGSLLRPQQLQQREARGGHGSFPSSTTSSSTSQHKSQSCRSISASDSVGSPSISSSQMPSPPSSTSSSSSPPSSSPSSSSAQSPHCPAPDSTSTRQRRFLNTAEILNQSGLLAITLRTKELLKQSATTERELIQLRQHTHVLCNIAQAGQTGLSGGVDNLNKLFQDMEKSGSYPNLDLHHLKALSGGQVRAEEGEEKENQTRSTRMMSVSLCNMDDRTSLPSPLFAPSPEPVSTSVATSFPDSLLEHRLTVREESGSSPLVFPESSTNYLL